MSVLKIKSLGILTLTLMLCLFWGCASQQASLMEDEFDSDSDIDAELEDLFDLNDMSVADSNNELNASEDFLTRLESDAPFQKAEEEPFAPVAQSQSEEESLQEVLALLLDDDEEEDPFPTTMDSFNSMETFTPVEQSESETTGLESYALENDVLRLEDELENKNQEAQRLRLLIDEKNKRIEQLERNGTPTQTRAQPRSSVVVNTSQFSEGYASARSLFESFKYSDALAAFKSLLASQPNHYMADNCQYWIGECYFGLKQYDQAVVEFEKVFSFSRKDKFDDAQMMIALSYIRNGQRDMAKQAFDKLFSNYPDSEYSARARKMYQNL